jgi:predicted transcriptional regulator
MASISQQVLNDIGEIYGSMSNFQKTITEHLAYDKANCQKIDAMYKLLITGNGTPPIMEVVRKHDMWIDERKETLKKIDDRAWQVKLRFIGEGVAVIGIIVIAIKDLFLK